MRGACSDFIDEVENYSDTHQPCGWRRIQALRAFRRPLLMRRGCFLSFLSFLGFLSFRILFAGSLQGVSAGFAGSIAGFAGSKAGSRTLVCRVFAGGISECPVPQAKILSN